VRALKKSVADQSCSWALASRSAISVEAYQDFGWQSEGTGLFPETVYREGYPASSFLKHAAAAYIDALLAAFDTNPPLELQSELAALRATQPHALITTNYDQLLERLFPDFRPIVGQQIIRESGHGSIGDILKIHGCTNQPDSLVMTEADYQEFLARKKYLSAKLLTYFIEFPVIILGYSAQDRNISQILADVSEMVPAGPDDRMENIWFLKWDPGTDPDRKSPEDHVLNLGEGKTLRVRYLVIRHSFESVFSALAQPVQLQRVSVRLLRALSSNVYNIVTRRSARAVDVNLDLLQQHSDQEELTRVLGFSDAPPAETSRNGGHLEVRGHLEVSTVPVAPEVSRPAVTKGESSGNDARSRHGRVR